MSHRRVKGNSVQPSVKCRRPAELVQLDKCLHEGLLDDIFGIFRTAHQVYHRIVQAVLVPGDQLPECRRVTGERGVDLGRPGRTQPLG